MGDSDQSQFLKNDRNIDELCPPISFLISKPGFDSNKVLQRRNAQFCFDITISFASEIVSVLILLRVTIIETISKHISG